MADNVIHSIVNQYSPLIKFYLLPSVPFSLPWIPCSITNNILSDKTELIIDKEDCTKDGKKDRT